MTIQGERVYETADGSGAKACKLTVLVWVVTRKLWASIIEKRDVCVSWAMIRFLYSHLGSVIDKVVLCGNKKCSEHRQALKNVRSVSILHIILPGRLGRTNSRAAFRKHAPSQANVRPEASKAQLLR